MNKVQRTDVERLDKAISLIRDAKEAFIAIGDMMQPEDGGADEQLNMVYRSQAAKIFTFFGNSLHEPVRAAGEICSRLELATLSDSIKSKQT